MKIEIEGKIIKQGNSYYLRLPKQILDVLKKSKGDNLKVEIKN